jgi:uncharacterized protein (TIGR02271 family)
MTDEREMKIPVVEERAVVAAERRTIARVRVKTETERFEESVTAELRGEEVEITRVPMNVEIEAPPPIRTEGEVTIVPVVEERLVLQKRLTLTEELHLHRRQTSERVDVPVTLRRQRAVVERVSIAEEDKRQITPSSNEDQNHG